MSLTWRAPKRRLGRVATAVALAVVASALVVANSSAATSTAVLVPGSDVAAAGVSMVGAGTYWAAVDDGTAFAAADDDTTRVETASGTTGTSTVGYSAPAGTVTQVVANVRARATKFAAGSYNVLLYDGATLIGTGPSHGLGTSYRNFSDTFSGLNVASGSNLRTTVRLANAGGRGTVAYTMIWLQATLQTATTTTTPTSAPPTTAPATTTTTAVASAPTVSVSTPSNGATVSSPVSVTGTASAAAGVSRVDVAVDGGAYQAATGSTSWTFPWNTSGLSGSHTLTARVTDLRSVTATASVTVSVASAGITDLRNRTDLIYGSEIGAWRTTGAPATDLSTPIPGLVKAAKIPLVRFSVYDVFTDMTDPAGSPGTQSRANFDAAINSIRANLNAEVVIKLLPISQDVIGTKNGTLYCPPLNNLGRNLDYYKAVVAQAGSRVRMYESSNEMEYDCYKAWGFSSAGTVGVSKVLGDHFAQNMPALKKYARSLGFEIATVGYIGTPGGFGWGDSVANPRVSNAVEFLTATHDAYVASGYDPDYIPDAISIHAYPYSGDFCGATPLSTCNVAQSDIIAYYDAWTAKVRQQINAIWGTTIGNTIKLAVSEWNAGAQGWSGFSDSRVDSFYSAWLAMLKRNGYWFANQFALASNGSQPYDMIKETGATTSFYNVFKAASTS